jgi:ABC-type lipoprotein release transport system permease subunit
MALPLSYNVRNVRQRWKVTVLAIGGIALVVAVFITLIALYNGFRIALASTGIPGNGIFVQRGSQSELTSGIGRDDVDFLSADDRVARNAQGQPLASRELVVAASLPRRDSTLDVNVQLRGVSPMTFEVRSGIRIVEGQNLQPGLTEIIVGRRLAERIDGVRVGDSVKIKRRDWRVVGIFTAEGSSFESEVWGDVDVMAAAFNRVGGYQSLVVRMNRPDDIPGWAAEVERNPRLQLQLKPERQYYDEQAGPVGTALLGLALFVAIVMAIGAVFGAMNTMYAVVAARTREIATLRALGFRRRSILLSFLIESMLIALAAGAIGCALGMFANWLPTAATGNVTFSELAFAFRVTPQSLAIGMTFALVMGFVGGLLPAVRAALLPITKALRDA